jgi:hypothetical protein
MVKLLRRLPGVLSVGIVLVLMAVSLYPLLDKEMARKEARHRVDQVRTRQVSFGGRWVVSDEWLLAMREHGLASWGNIGGCGASAAATSSGGVKGVGRGVTGGLMDLQCILSQSVFPDGAQQSTFSTRLGTGIGYKWLVAATLPFRYNLESVSVWDEQKEAHLPGFGDIGLEVTRKLGIANAHTATLSLTFPVGAHDAVRKGVVLPQRMQLGAGVVSASGVYEYTRDFDWGPMILGGNVFYSGWENSIDEFPDMGDFRGSGASGYVYAGYMLGPFVPSLGLNLTAKITGDRERDLALSGQPMVMVSPTVALEWSMDWLAVLISLSTQLSLFEGSDPLFGGAGDWAPVFELETWTVGLGVQTSIF